MILNYSHNRFKRETCLRSEKLPLPDGLLYDLRAVEHSSPCGGGAINKFSQPDELGEIEVWISGVSRDYGALQERCLLKHN